MSSKARQIADGVEQLNLISPKPPLPLRSKGQNVFVPLFGLDKSSRHKRLVQFNYLWPNLDRRKLQVHRNKTRQLIYSLAPLALLPQICDIIIDAKSNVRQVDEQHCPIRILYEMSLLLRLEG